MNLNERYRPSEDIYEKLVLKDGEIFKDDGRKKDKDYEAIVNK